MKVRMLCVVSLVGVLLGPMTEGNAQTPSWTVRPRIGFVDLAPRSFGLGINYDFAERRPVYGVTLSRNAGRRSLEVSYLFIPSRMETSEYVFESPGPARSSATLAVADLAGHLFEVGLSIPIVRDRETDRAFVASLGTGVAVFDPAPNHLVASPGAGPREESVPTDLEITVDPLIRAGVGLSLPVRGAMALRVGFSYVLQFCNRGDHIESRYLCSRSAMLNHALLEAGLRVPLFD